MEWLKRALAAGLLLPVLICAGCDKDAPARPREAVRPVRFIRVSAAAESPTRMFSGTSKAVVESRLSFRVGGTIQKVNVAVGDAVKKGDLIARIDPADFRIRVQEAEASLARAEAEARNAEANYERVRALYENRNASRNDLDAARAAAESTEAAAAAARKQLELARRQLEYTRLTAPSDCAVASVSAEVNENVAAGQTVAAVTCGDRIDVNVTVPEAVIARINEGDPAAVRFDAVPGETFPGAVTEVGVTSAQLETTFPVAVRLDARDPRVRPGMAAEVALHLRPEKAGLQIMVPPAAVGEDRNGRFVFTVTPSDPGFGVVHRQSVQVGEITSDGLEIKEGLRDGDFLVTAGVNHIQDGLKVKFNPEKEDRP